MLQLRPYQQNSVDNIRGAYLAQKRAPLLVLPTGGGKTVVFSYIAANTSARGKRVLILVHRVELLRQTSAALLKAGVTHGLINPKFTPNVLAPVQVASVQTLIKRLHLFASFDLIIIDEAHHATAGSWRKILDAYPNSRRLGVTATPIRSDGTGLDDMFDDIIIGPQISQLIEQGYLARPIVYAPMQRVDLSGLRTKMGDYDKDELVKRMDKPHITGSAVDHYRKLCPGSPAVAFCVSIEHAKHVAEQFRQAGFRSQAVDGSLDDETRKGLLASLGNGRMDVITSCDLISEGTDIPAIACAILLRPTQSTGLFLQQVGRALRVVDGKENAYILDHVGNVLMHGMPEQDREWTLEGTPKRAKKKSDDEPEIKVKQCDQCYAIHEPAPVCPQCGYVYKVEGRKLDVQDGELQQITKEAAAVINRAKKLEVAKADSLEALKEIARARGYNVAWAEHVYQAKLAKGRIRQPKSVDMNELI
jgi:superfamily II DNA or RNA helicase